jgi:hypothetical protein
LLAVLAIVTPVFALMGLGYLAARLTYLPEAAGPALSQFAFKIAIPCMLFRAMLTAAPLQASPWALLAAYFLAVAAIWTIATLLVAFVLGKPAEDQAPLAMSATFGNTVMLGIPIAVMAFGPEATPLLAILIAVETPLLWIAGTLHIEFARRGSAMSFAALGGVAKDLIANPIILSLVLGIASRGLGLELPAVPDRIFALLGLVAALKLFALPALAYVLAAHVFALPPLVVAVIVLHAAMPVGANPFLFATRYERGTGPISAAIVASTLAAVVTVSVLLLLLGAGAR